MTRNVDEHLYEDWLRFLFDRPDAPDRREWYSEVDATFHASPEQQVVLIGKTFERSGKDLLKYSDTQVANGLEFIFNNAISSTIYFIVQKGVEEEIRLETVSKMTHLYSDCLANRCSPVLSHLDEEGGNKLNLTCYMLWDTSPLCQWKDVVLGVMESALYLPNSACIESGIHGLGHRFSQDKERVSQIIDKFLSKAKSLRPELRQYALNARTGHIQ